MRTLAVLALLYLAAWPATAEEVFKCTGADGTKTYSQQPCAGKAETLTVRDTKPKEPFSRQLERWCDAGAVTPAHLSQCLGAWKPVLRDPGSVSVRHATEVVGEESRERAIFIDLFAKNGFGGLSYLQARCGLDKKSGAIDAALTREWMSFSTTELPQSKARGLDVESCGPKARKRP